MIIRIAKNSDLDTINSIRIEYSQGLINHSDIPNHLGFITFVGIIDDSVIGYISLSPETEKDQYSNEVFLSVFIKSKFQGNKYGPQLIAKAIEHSENSKFANLIKLAVSPKNERAIKIYKDFGFISDIDEKKHLCKMVLYTKSPEA